MRATSVVVADHQAALAVESRVAAEQLDAVVLEPAGGAGVVQVVDDFVAPVEHGLGVDRPRDGLGHARDPRGLGQQLARAQQRLGGHARVERALPADQIVLHDRHVKATVAQPACRDLAGRSGAHHNHVEFPFAHAGVLPPRQGRLASLARPA